MTMEIQERCGLGIVTRCPLVLRLHKINEGREYPEFMHLPRKRFTDFAAVRKDISDETDREIGHTKQISSVPIHLTIYSPNGFEISLCGSLLRAGMGLGPAAEAFDENQISEEFKSSAAVITKNENLIVGYKQRYLRWDKAAPIALRMAAFGLDLPVETKDVIPVEQDETPKPKEDTPEIASTPSGRRWRLWSIPFRRVKTLQHTTSNSSNEEVFVDSESGSHEPHMEPIPAPNGSSDSPQMKILRTNVPTTDQIASLNLEEG